MHNEITLGATPSNEPCVSVTANGDYFQAMQAECGIFKRQLIRQFVCPDHVLAYFKLKTNPHDFGSYMEVILVFEDADLDSSEFANNVEENLPDVWDSTARKEIELSEILRQYYGSRYSGKKVSDPH